MGRFRRIFAAGAATWLVAATAWAQSAQIQGRLVDAQGGAIPGAQVSAIDEDKGLVTRETTSDASGFFQLVALLRGRYTVRAELSGFKTVERGELVLDPNQVLELGDLTLEVGAVTETVEVQVQMPVVETGTSQKSYTISDTQVRELSLNGRDFTSLLKTLPGVATNETGFLLRFNATTGFNVNGLRDSMNNVMLDGTPNTDTGANDGQYTQLSLDAVGEFKLQSSSYNAEFGRNPGALITATTRSGGQQFRGTLYGFRRDGKWDAVPHDSLTGERVPLDYNQAGGNFGGWVPIPGISSASNKKLFFFFNHESTRADRPAESILEVLHPDLLNGDFGRLLRFNDDGTPVTFEGTNLNVGTVFKPGTIVRDSANAIIGGEPYPNNIIPTSEWNGNAQGFLNVLNQIYGQVDISSAEAVPGTPQLLRVPFDVVNEFSKDQEVLRVDYQASASTSMFFRMVLDSQREGQPRGIFSTQTFPVIPMFREKPGQSYSFNLYNVVSPSVTNELIIGVTNLDQVVDKFEDLPTDRYDRDLLGFTMGDLYPVGAHGGPVNPYNKFPNFNCGESCAFSPFPLTWRSEAPEIAITDNVTWQRGEHTYKTGIFFNMAFKAQQPSWTMGNLDFNPNEQNINETNYGLANLLLGNYTTYQQSDGIYYGDFRYIGAEGYVQDTWRVNPRLTLDYGLRLSYLGPTYSTGQFLQNYFVPEAYDASQAVDIFTGAGVLRGSVIPGTGNPFNGMVEEGSSGLPKGGIENTVDFAPRAGLSWDVKGDGQTAVRAGVGIFYERFRQNTLNFDGLGSPPLSYTPRLFGGNVDDIAPELVSAGVRFPVGTVGVAREGHPPRVYSWYAGVQHQLPWNFAIDASYIGNRGTNLAYQRNINQLPLGSTIANPPPGGVNDAVRPFLGYTNVTSVEFGAESDYHGLQARLTRRFGDRFTANVGYTLSRAQSHVDADGTTIDYFLDLERQWGLAGFDRLQMLTLDYVYELPDIGTLWVDNAIGRVLLNGWQISGVSRFWSGTPLTITSNGNPGTTGGGVRAEHLGGDLYPAEKTRDTWFNPLAFGRPADGTLGTTPKGFLRGPGINQWDISLFKNTRVNDRVTIQFRLETFNAFNQVQFDGIETGIDVPNAGQAVTGATREDTGRVTTFRAPRQIQAGLKIYF
ncbi:MAG: TonB-dependent receptor plug domain-containing protein [Luteitalea sp.]|nr:TonB-dependent receptor plug domain-containing protein [Luteitalea sp.]